MDDKILILYKNHTLDLVTLDMIRRIDLSSGRIQCICIPYTDVVNGYIPIKPSYICNAKNAHIKIVYQGFQIYAAIEGNWTDEDYDVNFPMKIFEVDCSNLIEIVNAIYNLLKFRGSSIFIGGDCQAEFPVEEFDGYYNYPRSYEFTFYDDNGQIIHEVSTGLMKSLMELYLDDDAPVDSNHEFIIELIDTALLSSEFILYLPDKKELPGMIQLCPDHWNGVKKPSGLSTNDLILTYDNSYGIYYFSSYEFYLNLLKSPPTDFFLYGLVIDMTMKGAVNLLSSEERHELPSIMEKLKVCQVLEDPIDDYLTPITISTKLEEPTKYIEMILFLSHIALTMKCCLFEIYGRMVNQQFTLSDKLKIRTVVVFNYAQKQYDNINPVPHNWLDDPFVPNKMLTEMELDHANIMKVISDIITGYL